MSRRRGTDDATGVRGFLLASSSAALAIAAHGLAGGAVSDFTFTVLLASLLAWGGMSLARRGGTTALVAVLGVTQACQHVLLTELSSRHRDGPAVFDGWTMFATHAVATVLTAILLTRAGAALTTIASAFAWLMGALRVLVAGPVPPRPVPAGTSLPARPGAILEVQFRQVCARRGPPATS
ncbi:hypothetical protein [Actinophytocola sp.]|uniref:hypothetical protein n=1 Tax=Actinophytocola sp. TaxID=1872138 RepID=UPI002ED66BB6